MTFAMNSVAIGAHSVRASLGNGTAKREVLHGVTSGSQVLAARFDNLREGAKASVMAARSAAVASASKRPASAAAFSLISVVGAN